jgi:hypothetical protein
MKTSANSIHGPHGLALLPRDLADGKTTIGNATANGCNKPDGLGQNCWIAGR